MTGDELLFFDPMPGALPIYEALARGTAQLPGRRIHHFILSHPDQLDGDLWGWVREAYDFAQTKGRR